MFPVFSSFVTTLTLTVQKRFGCKSVIKNDYVFLMYFFMLLQVTTVVKFKISDVFWTTVVTLNGSDELTTYDELTKMLTAVFLIIGGGVVTIRNVKLTQSDWFYVTTVRFTVQLV